MSEAPKTTADFFALPIGGGFGCEMREIDGKLWRIPVLDPVVAFYVDDATPTDYSDENGDWWRLGRYADGRWFREMS